MDTQLEDRIREIVREEIAAYFKSRVEALDRGLQEAEQQLFDAIAGN